MKFSVSTMYVIFFFMLTLDNFLLKWSLYEISMIIMVMILNVTKGSSKMVSVVYYSVSSITSIILLFTIVFCNNITLMSSFSSKLLFKFMMIMIFIKLSMFPFHNWMIYCYEKSSWNQIFLMSSIMKFIPISFFCHFMLLWNNIIIFLIINSIFMSFYVNINFSLKKMLACSTSFNNFLLIYMFMLNIKQFILFTIIYSIILYYLTYILSKFNCSKLFIIYNFKNIKYLFKMLIFIYSMLPMMMSFLLKWNFLYEMSKFNNYISFIYFMFLISNLLMMWKYMVIIKNLMLMKKFFIFYKMNLKINISIFILLIFFFFMFIMYNFLVD
uniref:NADH dehydrogenase subunit 2 n=1 Tax=Geniotrigona thoracica TaxID=395500 RepID=UPI003D53F538